MIRFGVSRAHGGARLDEGARLLGAALEGQLDQPVEVSITADYEQLLDGVMAAALELAWLPPLLQTRALAAGATLAAVSERHGALVYRSAILVRADSRFQTVDELRGARAAFSDRHSAAGYFVPRKYLQAAGIDPARDLASEELCGSMAGSLAAVVEGRADFCACFVSEPAAADGARALADIRESQGAVADSLRVLALTGSIPPDGMVIAPGVETALAAKLSDALLHLHNAPAGRAALGMLMRANRLAPATDEVRRLLSTLTS